MNAKKAKRLRRVCKDMEPKNPDKFYTFMKGAYRIAKERVLEGMKQYERKRGWN